MEKTVDNVNWSDLSVTIDKRAKGKYYHKMPHGLGGSKKVKQIALKDITEECGDGKFYSKNYISHEYLVLQAIKEYGIK